MKKQRLIVIFLILAGLIIALEGCATAQPTISSTFPSLTTIPTVQASAPAPTSTNLPTIQPTFTLTLPSTPIESGLGRIAFTSDLDGDFEIYTMNVDGSNQVQLTNNYAWDCCARWSPDSTKIVFVSRREENMDIYLMDADGSDEIRLTDDPANDESPSWSPDGDRIAYSSGASGISNIYVMHADGSERTRLTDNELFNSSPNWSPHGTKIAYLSMDTRNDPTAYEEIFVMNADGSQPVQLTHNEVQDLEPAWSPDGTRIAYVSTASHAVDKINWNIYVMNYDGNIRVQLTSGTTHEWSPVWSPDGTMMAFASCFDNPASSTGQICDTFMMNADGSNQTRLTDFHANSAISDWVPAEGRAQQILDCSSGWTRLQAGMFASVTEANGIPNRIRSSPSQADEVIAQIYPGTPVQVIEGPVCADGLVFWKVEHESIPGRTGWTAEGDGQEYWLEPYSP